MKIRTALLLTTLLGVNAMANPVPTSVSEITIPAQTIKLTQDWDKVFPKSDKVEHRKVAFKNRYGITLVGDLYIPKNAKDKLPAITVSGPFGAVKEQVSGLYAQTLAERGFVTLAFDGSYTGESSGLPRNVPSPEINTEDFSASVAFLANLDIVDSNKIGVLGVCGWGGFALNSAISDTRIKAVATSTMYDMTRVMANGYNDSVDKTARHTMRQELSHTRTQSSQQGYADLLPANNLRAEDFKADTPLFIKEYSDFYTTKRGFHPRAVNSNPNGSWASTGSIAFINMPILQYAQEMQTPALIVHGENAHSRYFSEDAFKALGSTNKELYIVPNATHVDLYDNQAGKIPFDKFEQFFKANLK
ncbi:MULTISPECIES: alpha/beta hydrolase [Moraxella]|mgnify:CR=1 FL=1|uniref:Xaa-Pro dipeptidyl-peptidase-like domain-containing protein n=1 Tax=Moraxella lacunata TaxID=477 RepID=A0A1B8PVL0_MORLA|nr:MULTISPECIES: alpha/beta hydrolase [Moraxella]MBE9579400.1 alpha/beta hydrolase [Moraxella sp. K1664]MBE9588747.1 alpha/beta hydrolase [Moraxella sp. K1630]MBE9591249.1 alpha/beta hydrolase [Moraxella sp. K127]MBE9596958.1 alpha/beta hydrolase [Moraxella sp. K2450]MDH9219538.1 alpha/beta hydrolase [Moraxella lacunata]